MTALRLLRERQGLTITQTAAELGVTPQAVSQYEHGTRTVDLEEVLILARLYKTDAEVIITAQLEAKAAHRV